MRESKLSLNGLRALSDEVGMFQHTKFATIDRREGYTTDDNARALIAALRYNRVFSDPDSILLAETYLTFLMHMQREDGRFHNLLGFDRRFSDEVGSEDCMGHALWACGYVLSSNARDSLKRAAKELFDRGLPPSNSFTSPRAKAFTLLGLRYYHEAFPNDGNVLKILEALSRNLVEQYRKEANNSWRWFEAYLTYANARLPQALFAAHKSMGDPSLLRVALDSLDFLIEIQMLEGIFQPIGTNGWFTKDGERAFYDQQPLEASCMVEAAIMAFDTTGKGEYKETATIAFEWYHGRNIKRVNLLNAETGTFYDGITPEGLNRNQGAEATLSYYLAYLKLREHNLV